MTDKELRRCSRIELIEMIYYLKRENDELKSSNEQLNSRLDTLIGAAAEKLSAADELSKQETNDENESHDR